MHLLHRQEDQRRPESPPPSGAAGRFDASRGRDNALI